MENALLVIVTALFSGLIATLVTILWQKKNQIRNEKIKIFTTLLSKRYCVADRESVEALNMIDVVFYSSQKVRAAWEKFIEATDLPESDSKPSKFEDAHLHLLELMAEDIGYKKINWENIKHYYYPKGLREKIEEEEMLRNIQIDAGIKQIEELEKSENTAKNNNDPVVNSEVLIEALKNPNGLSQLLELAIKAKEMGISK